MPRVHTVKKANKDYPQHGIKKGDTYYWWKFRYGGKRMSKTYPKRSQLTQSDFLSQLYDLQEAIANLSELDEVDDILSDIEQLKNECEERLENMPEHLRESSQSGQTLQERIDALDNWYMEIESVDRDLDYEYETDEEKEQAREDILEEIRNIDPGL